MLFQVAHPFRDVHDPHERAEDRFVGVFCHARHDFRRLHNVHHGRGGEDDNSAVHFVRIQEDPQTVFVPLVRGVSDNIHGVLHAGRGRKVFPEFVLCLVRERRQLQSLPDCGIGGHDAGAARIGEDGNAIASWNRLLRERQCVVEKLVNRFGPLDAGLIENGVVRGVRSRQRSGVRRSRPRPFGGAARLDRETGLVRVPGNFARDVDERAAVGYVFQIHEDHFGLRVILEVAEKIDLAHVGLVPEAHKFGKPHVAAVGKIENGHAQSSGLGDEGDVSGFWRGGGEAGIHANVGVGVDDAKAVWSHKPYVVFFGRFLDLALQFNAVPADFLEAGGDDHNSLYLFFPRLFYDRRHDLAGHDNHGHVHRIGNILEPRVGFDAVHRF